MTLSCRAAVQERSEVRCQCTRCPRGHRGPCSYVRGGTGIAGRPVVIVPLDGKRLCHFCANRILEIQGRRLFA